MRFFLSILLLCGFSCAGFAQDSNMAAEVLSVNGLVKAVSSDLQERTLSRGSEIFVHEKIIVADDAKAQIKFTDGGLMNLIAATEFVIDSYRHNVPGQKDQYVGNLVKGGFRAISGSIGKANPENYEVKTPSATIGLQGTAFDVSVSGSKVYCGCDVGVIKVYNAAGVVRIGVGEPKKFTYIASPTDKPILLAERPTQLNTQKFTPPSGGQASPQTPGEGTSGKVGGGQSQQGRVQISDQGGTGCG